MTMRSEQWWRHEVSNAWAEGYEKGRASVKQPEQEIESDRDYVEDDGRPTEKAVLQRFWREHQTQEPVAYDKTDLNAFVQNLYDVKMREGKHGHYETMFYVVQQTIKHVCGNKQPVAWLCKNKKSGGLFALTREQLTELGYGNISMPPFEKTAPLYTAPPQREWQGLTDGEIDEINGSPMRLEHSGLLSFARAIEAKLKEKNEMR
jgi:hypothetical protein